MKRWVCSKLLWSPLARLSLQSIQFEHLTSGLFSQSPLGRRFPGCSGSDIEDSGSFRSTQKKTQLADSFLHRFRKKGLAVTDITATEWCEKQMEFVLLHGKRKVGKGYENR